jgi:3-methylfumaryl-CoA hydratase
VTVTRTEILGQAPAEGYRGTFAAADAPLAHGDLMPPGWEGVYFPFAVALDALRPDGTPARDGVLPEIDLPRRMYAGEDTEFVAPLRVGDEVEQTTTLGDLTEKQGRSGRLVFVDLVREYRRSGALAVRSVWHDVFLPAADPAAPAPLFRTDSAAAGAADWVDEIRLDARQLFRFSALTFNTHLIHYDRAWARDVEQLPDLLVQGPLTRILLMDAARRHVGRDPARLRFRSTAPVLVDRIVRLCGSSDAEATRVVAVDEQDVVLASAEIEWRSPA